MNMLLNIAYQKFFFSTHRRIAAVGKSDPLSSSNPFSASNWKSSFTVWINSSSTSPTSLLCFSYQPKTPGFVEFLAKLTGKADPAVSNPAVCGVRPGTGVYEQTKPDSPNIHKYGRGSVGGSALALRREFDFSDDNTKRLPTPYCPRLFKGVPNFCCMHLIKKFCLRPHALFIRIKCSM